MRKLRFLWVYLNMWRILPAYLFAHHNLFKEKCKMDIDQWLNYSPDTQEKKRIFRFGYMMLYEKACRNILLNRLHRNVIMFAMIRILFKPLESCYINMPPENIGGGFSLQHGFSTIISAQKIGERCRVYQQVTIGYHGEYSPIIGNDVSVTAGAIVIGNVQLGDGVVVGAGSVVTKNVAPYTTVAGVPARVLKVREPN